MAGKFLIVDCDGVFYDTLPVIDEQVKKVNYYASDEYGNKLKMDSLNLHNRKYKLEEERSNNCRELLLLEKQIENSTQMRKMHFDLKDLVLEEVLREYKNRINYAIYTRENAFPGAIDQLNEIADRGVYDQIFMCSHVNTDCEVEEKYKAVKKEFQGRVILIPVKFHSVPYFDPITGEKNVNRLRANKIELFKIITGIKDLSKSSFIDDKSDIVDEARDAGVGFCYHKTPEDNTRDLLRRAYIDTLYGESRFKGKTKTKSLF